MFSNRDLRKLIIPLMIEQLLSALMGTVDTLMVSRLGDTCVSGVSCVDTINKLVIFLLSSIATGGTIVCSQFIGRSDSKNAGRAGQQVLLCSTAVSLAIMTFCLVFRTWLLNLIFGSVEAKVMESALTYFLITSMFYPFTAIFNACSAACRAAGNSRLPMLVSVSCNLLNIVGNYLLMFVVRLGVAGAAISTTASTALSAAVMLIFVTRPGKHVEIGSLLKLKPDFRLMLNVMRVGLPTGVENSVFQLGKLVVQSTVATLGTMAITSNAIVTQLELITSMPSQGIGIGLVTVAGQCFGARRIDEAKKYMKKLTVWSTVILFIINWAFLAVTVPVCHAAGFDAATTDLTFKVMLAISIVKPFLWPLAFVPENGLRSAGDVNFMMLASIISMWVCRVGLTTLLCRFLGVGLIGIWCGYFLDWFVKSIVFIIRYRSGKWTRHKVID